MRHRRAHRKLGRVADHRVAMLRNQATALIRYEHLTTTVPRAKELRPFVERLITIAKRGVANGAAASAGRAKGTNGSKGPDARLSERRRRGPCGRGEAVRHAGAAFRDAGRRLHAAAATRLPKRRCRGS